MFDVLFDGEVRRRQQVIAEIGEAGVMRLAVTMGSFLRGEMRRRDEIWASD